MTHPDPRLGSIGIFDSGFGGLTVMRAIRELMPYENIIYFGDTARLPYGSKSAETILRYSIENASFLATQGIKVLVIACNTSCSAALDQVRKTFDIPVIGITEQGVEEVSRLLPEGKVAILGTRATITSGVYQHQILSRCSALELFFDFLSFIRPARRRRIPRTSHERYRRPRIFTPLKKPRHQWRTTRMHTLSTASIPHSTRAGP